MLDLVGRLPLADILLVLAALAAGAYCLVLSRRLNRFNNLENGMGGAIALLSAQITDLNDIVERAEGAAKGSADQLADLTQRSEDGAAKLEMLLASLHDLPDIPPRNKDETPATFVRSDAPETFLEAAE